MPPNRSTRSARTGEIPEHFIVNWRSSGQSGPVSPLPRRPITACEHCHAAKVRCNARQDCQRCIARRLVCTYANQTASPGSTTSGSSSQAGNGLEAWSPASPPPHVSGTQVPSQQLPPLVDMSQPAAGTADSGYMVTASTAGEYGGAINLPSVVPLGWDNTLPSVVSSLLSRLHTHCVIQETVSLTLPVPVGSTRLNLDVICGRYNSPPFILSP